MTMERTLPADWRPDDAPGADLPLSTLKKRCAARNLSVLGFPSEMIERLDHYQRFGGAEKRRFSWLNQASDLDPFRRTYERALQSADCTRFRIVHVKDKSGLDGGNITKHFLVTHEGDRFVQVNFGRVPGCTCMGTRPTCVHIVYVLRYVLNCPEPLRWQNSFLSSELEDIYRHSYAVSTLLLTDWKGQDPFCALCFKTVFPTEGHRTCCVTCGRATHTDCVGVAQKAKRQIELRGVVFKEDQCLRCKDETDWGIDKYCEPGQVQYPLVVPGTEAALQMLPGPGGNTAQQANKRTASDAVIIESSGSSRGEHSGPQANNPPSTSADPAPGTATAPASAATPDTALAPASGTASVEDPASTTTNASISDRDSAKLVRDRGRLAKELAEMRKRAKREYKKLNRKHKKELKKLRKKSKRELEMLMKKSKTHKKELKKLKKKRKRELEMLMKKSKKLEKRARGLGG